MNITQISTYARRMAIPMQPNMSKQELITYLFYFLDQCEIPTTQAEEVKFDDKYKPLEFKVDLSQIDAFNNSVAKKVIFYEGDTQDESEMNSIIESENHKNDPVDVTEDMLEEAFGVAEAVAQVGVAEETSAPVAEEEPEATDVAWKILGKKEEPVVDKTVEEKIREEELLAEDIINETLAQIKEKKVEEEEIITVDVDVNKVNSNPYYASSKIYSSYKGNKGKVLLGLFLGLGGLAILASVILMFLL